MQKRFAALLALTVLSGMLFVINNSRAESVRKPTVAGQFYPANPAQLKSMIEGFLKKADDLPDPSVFGLIVPHAGYPYSGPTAARAYKLLQGRSFDTVIVVAFSHRTPLENVFVDRHDAYETPLGTIPVDLITAEAIRSQDPLLQDEVPGAFPEHSLEVQLPFLQTVLGSFKLVPVYMGSQSQESSAALGKAIAKVIRGKNALLIASTDCSHFYDDATARKKDARFAELVESGDIAGLAKSRTVRTASPGVAEACGTGPVMAFLTVVRELGWKNPELIHYSNSGDATGDLSNVVGYAAMAARLKTRPEDGKDPKPDAARHPAGAGGELSAAERKALLSYSRKLLEAYFAGKPEPKLNLDSPLLLQKRGVFVTLKQKGRLRGCIGCIIAQKPARDHLRDMTLAAALEDPRFEPVRSGELEGLDIHISVLTEPKAVKGPEEVRLGTDGIIIRQGFRSGVYLPEVAAETGWSRDEFIRHCAVEKAGISPKDLPKAQIYTFQTESFGENPQ